jgi:hypothetical protein
MLIFYGATDTLCMPAETLAFAASVGASATTVSIATGHAEATYSSVNHDQAVAFLNANA